LGSFPWPCSGFWPLFGAQNGPVLGALRAPAQRGPKGPFRASNRHLRSGAPLGWGLRLPVFGFMWLFWPLFGPYLGPLWGPRLPGAGVWVLRALRGPKGPLLGPRLWWPLSFPGLPLAPLGAQGGFGPCLGPFGPLRGPKGHKGPLGGSGPGGPERALLGPKRAPFRAPPLGPQTLQGWLFGGFGAQRAPISAPFGSLPGRGPFGPQPGPIGSTTGLGPSGPFGPRKGPLLGYFWGGFGVGSGLRPGATDPTGLAFWWFPVRFLGPLGPERGAFPPVFAPKPVVSGGGALGPWAPLFWPF